MNINNLIKESHINAKEKSFYDCPECGGSGFIPITFENGDSVMSCQSCNGTGIDQNKNIPELLMLVITEISEAVEALRCGRFADWKSYSMWIKEPKSYLPTDTFELYIKDTFEDEIADVFIRLFNLCGYLEIEIDENEWQQWPIKIDLIHNKSEALFEIIQKIISLKKYIKFYKDGKEKYIELINGIFIDIFKHLEFFCNHNNIFIERHIKAKMEYNKTRPKKHGKEF